MAEPQQLTSARNGVALHDTPRGVAGSLEVHVIYGADDPSVVGRAAPIGSTYSRTSNGEQYSKIGLADTDWQLQVASAPLTNTVVIATTTTGTVQSIDMTSLRAVRWLVAIEDNTAGKYSSAIVHAVRESGGMRHSIPSDVGEILDYNVDVTLVANIASLEITNNEPNSLTVKALAVVL